MTVFCPECDLLRSALSSARARIEELERALEVAAEDHTEKLLADYQQCVCGNDWPCAALARLRAALHPRPSEGSEKR